jgi:hypothetical protein
MAFRAMLTMLLGASAFSSPVVQRSAMRGGATPPAQQRGSPVAVRMAAKPRLTGANGVAAKKGGVADKKGGVADKKPAKSVTTLNLIDLINPVNPYSWVIWFFLWINAVAYFK